MTPYATLIIRGQPVSKKNSMQLARIRGRFFPVPSASYRKWMTIAKPQIRELAARSGFPLEGPVWLRITAHRWSMRKIDLSNIYAAVEDMLQKYGIIRDDSQVQAHDGSRKILGVSKEEARVEIEIFPMDDKVAL